MNSLMWSEESLMSKCKSCYILKPISQFLKKDPHMCKKCNSQKLQKWNEKNPKSRNVSIIKYIKKRLKTDVQFKLSAILRGRLYNALKGNYKKGSAVRDLGCSLEDLKIHLEKQFQPGMSWDNYGNKKGQWSIDHIKPLSKFDLTDKNQLLEACNYKNLQPMWHIENIKKSNKYA